MTLNYKLQIHTSTLTSLTAAMEEDSNETSQPAIMKMADFSYMKNVPRGAKHQG